MVLYFLLCCVFDRFDNGIKQGFGVIENVAGKNFFSLVVMMGAIPKRRVISRLHIGEMTGGQQSAGKLGEEFNPFFGRQFWFWIGVHGGGGVQLKLSTLWMFPGGTSFL
jgi:hypothetical protein